MTSNAVAKVQDVSIMEEVIAKGNLAELSPDQRAEYYVQVCKSMGLNPFTLPFAYIEMDKKLVLYATKNATDQLRQKYAVNIEIIGAETIDNMRMVTVQATTVDGRIDTDIAVVPLEKEEVVWTENAQGKSYPKKTGNITPLTGPDLANAYMKAITKAKRRVTLSVVGLSFIDESELETVSRKRKASVQVSDDLRSLQADNDAAPDLPIVEQVEGELVDNDAMTPPNDLESADWNDQVRQMYKIASREEKTALLGKMVSEAKVEFWRFKSLIVLATTPEVAATIHKQAEKAGADGMQLDEWMGDFEVAQAMTAS